MNIFSEDNSDAFWKSLNKITKKLKKKEKEEVGKPNMGCYL